MSTEQLGKTSWFSGGVLLATLAGTVGLAIASGRGDRQAAEPSEPTRSETPSSPADARTGAASAWPLQSVIREFTPDRAPRPAERPLGAVSPGASAAPGNGKAYVIAAIGDSLTDPKSHGGKYLEYVKKRCKGSRIDNYGKGGSMVNQMRRRFLEVVLPNPIPYSHLVVFGGVNDLYSDKTAGRTPEKIAADLSLIYAKAKQRGMKVVAITVAPWGGFSRYYNDRRGENTRRVNEWIQAELAEGKVDHVVDAYALLSCGRPEYLCPEWAIDGIHFNAKGHEVLGRALVEEAFPDCR